ncbi:hypothetical protein JXL83_02330 [candidate division WOR-3 bacterium]|nr:hypothetical protein [candidate division WOR-3 bacterium]
MFEKKIRLIPTSLALCDARFIPFLEIFPFKTDLYLMTSWIDFFSELSDSSSSHKKDGKLASANIESLSDVTGVSVVKISDCKSFPDLLKKNRKYSQTFVVSSETEADHLSMLYGIKNINFDRTAGVFSDKYWLGKFISVKPFEKDESGLKGRLPDGTIYQVKDEEHIPDKEITCRVSSFVKSSEGTILFLKRDKLSKRKLLWDLVL